MAGQLGSGILLYRLILTEWIFVEEVTNIESELWVLKRNAIAMEFFHQNGRSTVK